MAIAGLAGFTVSSPGCGGGDNALVITSPDNGTQLSLADDRVEDRDGIQINVSVAADGLKKDETIRLFVDADPRMDDGASAVASGMASEGDITFENVTFDSGEHELLACARDCKVASPKVTVSVRTKCADITFSSPTVPASGTKLLGPSDDADGEACGSQFQVDVQVSTNAGDGQTAQLFVNGNPGPTTTINGTLATFSGVSLGNRGDTVNTLEIAVENQEGVTCRRAYPADIRVDCEGVSCQLQAPSSDDEFLGSNEDLSDEEGFQTDFEVATGGEATNVTVSVDGDEVCSTTPMMNGDGKLGLCGNVTLEEGLRRVRATCTDEAGNQTQSSRAEWTVDTTPCSVSIGEPEMGDVFTDLDDQQGNTAGIQIPAQGNFSGEGCTSVRVGACSGSLSDAVTQGGNIWSGVVSLPTQMGTQSICAEVDDEAGNTSSSQVDVEVRTEAPQLEIVSPSDGTGFNKEGTDGRTVDGDKSTDNLCEAAFEVKCSDVGKDVTLTREGSTNVLEGGTAPCEEDGSVSSPFSGTATFDSVGIPTRNDGSEVSIVARQTADGLEGVSPAVSYLSDCAVPSISFAFDDPSPCGKVWRPSVDDSNTTESGFQHDIPAANGNTPPPPIVLKRENLDTGTTPEDERIDPPDSAGFPVFQDVTFGTQGDWEMQVCGTDSGGNEGCSSTCTVTIADLPIITIQEPSADVLTEQDDCNGDLSNGFQAQVTASIMDATSSEATIEVGGTSTSEPISSQMVSACFDASQGRGVTINVSASNDAGTATDSTTVDIDTQPPPDAIGGESGTEDDLTAEIFDADMSGGTPDSDERRSAIMEFSWTAVSDAGPIDRLDSYELRCADQEISTEQDWMDVTDPDRIIELDTDPASGGMVQSEQVDSFRVGVTEHCVLRGFDLAGRPTPLPSPNATVDVSFETLVIELSGTSNFGRSIAAIGDVNGGGQNDMLIGAPGASSSEVGRAYVYFPDDADGMSNSPDITIIGSHQSFGRVVTGLGDFDRATDSNDERYPDFAVAAPDGDGFKGEVFLFYGGDADRWPDDGTIDVTEGTCGADACLRANGGGLPGIGWSMAAARFNEDAHTDLVLGAPFINNGRAYVVLGKTLSGDVNIPVDSTVTRDTSSGSAQADGFYFDGPSDRDFLGASVTSPGSYNGDGTDDLLMGASGSSSLPAGVLGLTGRDYDGAGGMQQVQTSKGTLVATGSRPFAISMASGDYNGAGGKDVIVGGSTGTGRGFLFRQRNSEFASAVDAADADAAFTNDVMNAGDDRYSFSVDLGFHPSLGALGDLDQDGKADLLLGSEERGAENGSVDLFYGEAPPRDRPRSTSDVVVQPQPTDSPSPRVGIFVGDVTGDGYDDFAFGDKGHNSSAGRVILYY